MSSARSLLEQPGIEAVFVPSRPARAGRLGLWHPERTPPSFTDTIEVVTPSGTGIRQRPVPVTYLGVAEAIDALVELSHDAPSGASVHGWAAATRGALHLLARGRLLPAVDEDGIDGWRIGPFDPEDLIARDALADALSAAAHATLLPESAPRRVASPRWLVARYWDAVADAYVRTSSASMVVGHDAYAVRRPVTVLARGASLEEGSGFGWGGVPNWLIATSSGAEAEITVALRLEDADGAARLPTLDGATTTTAPAPTDEADDTGSGANGDDADDGGDADEERDGSLDAVGQRAEDRAAALVEAAFAETEPATELVAVRAAVRAAAAAEAQAQAHAQAEVAGAAPSGGAFRAVLEVGSVSDRSLVLDAVDLWTAPEQVIARFGPTVEADVLLALRRGARVWEPLGRLLAEARPDRIDLSGDEVADLLGPVADELAGSGIEVRWPAGVLEAVQLTPVLTSAGLSADREAGLNFGALCELRWDASIDGEVLSEHERQLLVAAKRGIVRLRGKWVRADPGRLARLSQRKQVSAGEALAAALSGELLVDGDEVAAVVEGPLAALGDRLRSASGRDGWAPPDGLHAELRPYQRDGAAWLNEMAELGLGGVLADDMGLGKTLQFLAVHLSLSAQAAEPKPALVICPVSVLGNWAREANRFTPWVPVLRYHGTARSLDHLPPNALVLTTYGVARREAEELARHPWGLVAADEAQAIKNPLSRTAKALRRIPSDARFALTGTPVENRLVDLWALLDWTTPGLLGPLERFRREVAVPIERDRDADVADGLAKLVRPFLLRRRKSDPDIAPDLPPKTETDRVVPLTTEQATLYQATVDEVMAEVEVADGMSRRGLVLKLLTGLKQICNHPAQYLKQDGPIKGRSGKLDAVTELVETITSEGEAVLVFTQYVAMGEILVRHLAAPDRPAQFLHGGVPIGKRQEMVDRFQAGEVPVFVISVKAGGTGLNLTRATHVIHYDRWWNPAVEDQASDRAWRIGQDRPVQVHRMVCEGTVEDKISSLLAAKRSIADSVITSGEGWISEMGDDDLRMLVALGAEDASGIAGLDGGALF